MINMADRADVAVRLVTFKLRFTHNLKILRLFFICRFNRRA
jgi:hypothetical protein